MAVPRVHEMWLQDLEAMSFPRARATRALHFSGNTSLENGISWIVDRENDACIDEMPLVDVDIDTKSSHSFPIMEEVKIGAQKLRDQLCKRKEEEEKRAEREKELNRRFKLGLPSDGHASVKSSALASMVPVEKLST